MMKRKHHGTVDEYSSEQKFHKLPLLCEKSGAILLLLVGPTAGSPGRQSEEILVDLKIFKILYGLDC